MALACFPVTDIEVLIIVVALAPAFAQTLSPCSVVLVIRALLLVVVSLCYIRELVL